MENQAKGRRSSLTLKNSHRSEVNGAASRLQPSRMHPRKPLKVHVVPINTKRSTVGGFTGIIHVSSPSELAKLVAMAWSEASGSVGSSSTSLVTRYDVIESSASEEENEDTHVQAQV